MISFEVCYFDIIWLRYGEWETFLEILGNYMVASVEVWQMSFTKKIARLHDIIQEQKYNEIWILTVAHPLVSWCWVFHFEVLLLALPIRNMAVKISFLKTLPFTSIKIIIEHKIYFNLSKKLFVIPHFFKDSIHEILLIICYILNDYIKWQTNICVGIENLKK